ncbi:MAG TPA: hypothetical protein VGN01_12110 [Acidobacteriaceae bacterium]
MPLALEFSISSRHFASRLVCRGLVFLLSNAFTLGVAAQGTAVVTNGRFTNLYVYPNSDTQTWEQHIASLRPGDAAKFSRASIDAFTQQLMSHPWPTYFDPLFQYSEINPPQFSATHRSAPRAFRRPSATRTRA